MATRKVRKKVVADIENVNNIADANKVVSTAQAAADSAVLDSSKAYTDSVATSILSGNVINGLDFGAVPVMVGSVIYNISKAGTWTNVKDNTNTSISVSSNEILNGVVQFRGNNGVFEKVVITTLPLQLEVLNNGDAFIIKTPDGKVGFRITDEAIIKGKFDISEIAILFQNLPEEIKHASLELSNDEFIDSAYTIKTPDGKIGFKINKEGKIVAVFDYSLSPIKLSDLDTVLKNLLFQTDSNEFTGYKLAIKDPDGKVGIGLDDDGYLIAKVKLSDGTVTPSMLSTDLNSKIPTTEFLRANASNAYDTEFGENDDLWRGKEVKIPINTSVHGVSFVRLSPVKTLGFVLVNTSGIEIQVIKSDLVIRGINYLGLYNPVLTSATLVTYKGEFRGSTPALPSSPAMGDFYICTFNTLPKTRTLSGVTMNEWDVLYWNGAWNVQNSPLPYDLLIEGDFFDVSMAGKYYNKEMVSGDRLIYVGKRAQSGYNLPIYSIQKAGEYFFKGDFNPSSFAPTDIKDGDVYNSSGSGTYFGITFQEGDFIFRKGGVWGKSASELINLPNNQALEVKASPSRHLIRRADRNNTPVTIDVCCYLNDKKRRESGDLVLYSDSLFGSGGVGTSIATELFPRAVSVNSFGGGTTNNVIASIEDHIRHNSDPHNGKTYVFWHGQNNTADVPQIKNGALKMAALSGLYNSRFIMFSVVGTLIYTWNGTRLVVQNQEDAFAENPASFLYELETWYSDVFGNRSFNTRKALLAAAVGRTRKSLVFPGMTEAAVATTYGIPPYSFYIDYDSAPFNPDSLNFLGYHSAAGLPTGGADLDYYVRIANGSPGVIIVKVSGVWATYGLSYDAVHLSPEGGRAIASQFKLFLNTKQF